MKKLIALAGIVSVFTFSTTAELLAYTGTNPWYRGDGNPTYKKPEPIRPVTQKPATTTQQKIETPKSAEPAMPKEQRQTLSKAEPSQKEETPKPSANVKTTEASALPKTVTIDELANITTQVLFALKQKEPEFLSTRIPCPTEKIETINQKIKTLEDSSKSIFKSEWETTSAFTKRRDALQQSNRSQIQQLSQERDQIIAEYERDSKKLEEEKQKFQASRSWDRVTGKYVVKQISLVYMVSSIMYDADAGKFDVSLYPVIPPAIFVSKSFSVRCSADYAHLTIPMPNIEEAKKFKSNFRGIIRSYADCPMTVSRGAYCVKEAVYEESTNWGESLLDLGLIIVATCIDQEGGQRVADDLLKKDYKERKMVSPGEY